MTILTIELPKILISENPEGEYGFLEELVESLTGEQVKVAQVGYCRDGGADVSVVYSGKKPNRAEIRSLLDDEMLTGEVIFK